MHISEYLSKFQEKLRRIKLLINLCFYFIKIGQPSLCLNLFRPAIDHDLPERIRKYASVLTKNGWYIDQDMTDRQLHELKKAFEDRDIAEVNKALVKYYEDQIEEIENYITLRFPHRKRILSDAFRAHKEKRYGLSILVFLSQTDGIFKEETDKYLFKKHHGKPESYTYINSLLRKENSIRVELYKPITENLPIMASKQEREIESKELNRHAVLHGESLDYDNQTNSIKAICLIRYISKLLDALHAAESDETE